MIEITRVMAGRGFILHLLMKSYLFFGHSPLIFILKYLMTRIPRVFDHWHASPCQLAFPNCFHGLEINDNSSLSFRKKNSKVWRSRGMIKPCRSMWPIWTIHLTTERIPRINCSFDGVSVLWLRSFYNYWFTWIICLLAWVMCVHLLILNYSTQGLVFFLLCIMKCN